MLNIGVDLIELSRAKSIYNDYSSRLGRYLSKKELDYVQTHRRPETALAEILAVKEASFKALDAPWFGLEGWKKIHLVITSPGRFKVRFDRSLLEKGFKHSKIWINVASSRYIVLARVMIEKKRSLGHKS